MAPMTMVSFSIEVWMPKRSAAEPSDATSFWICTQLDPTFANTYAEPESAPLSSSWTAVTTAVVPQIAQLKPNSSPAAPSLGSSFAVCTHSPFCFSKM